MSAPTLYLSAPEKHALDAGFQAAFGSIPEHYFSAPGRTEIGGNHTDHQRGRVLAAAVNLDTRAAVRVNGTNTIRILSEGDDVNPLIRKAVGASPELSKKIVKGILAAMSQKQKESLTVKFLNTNAEKLVSQVNEVAAKNGIVITLDNAKAVIK